MHLMQNQQYGTLQVDFYVDEARDIYLTIDQLAQGFGYKTRKGIENLMARYPYLKEKKLSVPLKLRATDGKEYKTRLFNKRGITEIGMLSRTEEGRQFRNWLYDYIEKLEKENQAFRVQREIERVIHKELNESIDTWEHKNGFSFNNIARLLCKSVTGLTPAKIKEQADAPDSTPGLDLMSDAELAQYRENAILTIAYLSQGLTYQEIKDKLLDDKKAPLVCRLEAPKEKNLTH
ncbi:BRO family protein [Aerococcus sp. UMB7834]|uniref:BRO family protein n=1 Tax=Aerococcus sp. UMB7834 TaxID=3046342 RepID=UPI00254D4323|nr:BRO family protein [Aerococcus sp. UMB7834]MDK6804239.1 hypothetical protein [Aerococcus sp. UMB7834]